MTPEEKKEAKRLYDIEYRKKNAEKLKQQKKEWYENNPDKIKESAERNRDNKKIHNKIYAGKNKDKLNEKKKQWALANKEKVTKAKSDYVKKMLETDPFYKMKHYLICSINQSIKKNGYTKKSRTYEILGCTFEEFKQHIESLWEPWMNWNNRGNWNGIPTELNTSWDIDHKIPLASAKTEEELLKLNHFSNLQPLCSYYNRNIKKDKVG